MKNYFILGLLLTLSGQLFSQENVSIEMPITNQNAIINLTEQVKTFPQEKIYLQLDRPYYSAGDRIWFRAHMVHAAVHTPLVLSRYIYVELLNAHNEVVLRKKIRPTDDLFYIGQIDLSPEIAPGWYSVRAYTNFMRNVGEDYFYRQRIYIGNTLKGLAGVNVNDNTGSYNNDFKKAVQEKSDFDVQFFPEGGNLIAGNMQMVGFKALAKNGFGTDISGRIVDDQNKELITFKSSHLGMGVLAITPEAGRTYTAICENTHGQSLSFKLPTVSVNNYGLTVRHNATLVNLVVLAPSATPRTDTLYLVGCLRGLPFFQSVLAPDSPGISIAKSGMNSGVTQFLLLNQKGEILSERLIYIIGKDKASLSLNLDKPLYTQRDAAHASILLKDSKGEPVEGNFAVSVTDDNDIKIDPNETTIESYLLLQSDLKGYIENPNAYFLPENKSAAYQLDLLMLTQGWKRYNTASTLAGNPDKANRFGLEAGPVITGKVQNFPARRGLPKVNVSFFAHNNMQFDAVTTDRYGKFAYPSREFPDSTTFLVQADKKPGAFVELVVDPDSFPKVENSCLFPIDLKQDLALRDFLKKSRDRYYYQNGMMSVKLKDVVVTAKKTDKNQELRKERGSMYSNPSYSFDEEDLKKATNILFLLAQAPGVSISGNNSITIRNATPLIMVDNMRYEMEDLQNIQTTDIKLIDILKEPFETMAYGQEGRNGVICIYLKRGQDRSDEPVELGRHQAKITPLGHSLPAEFYVPKYQVEENRKDPLPDLRSTIYWKPNVRSDSNGVADLYFYTADSQSSFTITAEGVTTQGEIIRYSGKFNKKPSIKK